MRYRQTLKQGWYVKQLDTHTPDVETLIPDETWLPATMPAQVHDILLAHDLISDPRVGKNATESAWVGEVPWAYACAFASPAEPGPGPVTLRFDGLDTLATVTLNGVEVGQFDNMHRYHALEVGRHLRPPGERNALLIVFASPLRYIANAARHFDNEEGVAPFHYIRKCRSDFNSYLGARPHAVKVGIFDDVTLDVPDRAWLEDVCVRPELTDAARAEVHVLFEAVGEPAQVRWALVDPAGQQVARGVVETAAGGFKVTVEDPQLWWPQTHGQPNLYVLCLDLVLDGEPRDSRAVTFGLRRIRPVLVDPQTGEKRFAFEVNGQQIYLRGACWAPLSGMTHCWSHERAARLLDLVERGRMNVLRVWGGGSVPPGSFYDECDRRGILVWQDFMFGYAKYPAGVPAFEENCRAEIEDVVRRLRNHPCILLWCGGNENHMGWDFQTGAPTTEGWDLFERVMPRICADLDPGRHFHPSSPYGGRVPNWPLEGDWHDYTTLKYAPHASVPLYASEIGRVSAPSVTSMRRFMSEEQLWPKGHDPRIRTPGQPAWPEMWQYRSVNGSWDKVGPIEAYCDPTSAEDLVRALGLAHGEYLQRRIERQRRGVPDGAPDGNRRCWGNTIWRLNDTWPIIYWSAIDYYLEPKIAYYFLRRAYAPVLVSFERTADRIAVWMINDSPAPAGGQLVLRRMRFDGSVLGELTCEVELPPGASRRCLDATDLGPVKLRDEFLWAGLDGQGTTLLLIGERYLHLPPATLTVRKAGRGIDVATDCFARQVTLEVPGVTGAVFEDNFFDLPPGEKQIVEVVDSAGGEWVRVRALNAQEVRIGL